LIYNKARKFVLEHHSQQIKQAQPWFYSHNNSQNIIDQNLAELVTFINIALAEESAKVTNQLFNQGLSKIYSKY